MSEQWYLRHQGNELGPLAEEQLLQMATDGEVAPSAEIRKEGTTRWVTAIRVKGLFSESTDAPPVAGPPAAAALLIFSQVFKKPLQEMAQIYYNIQGPFADPLINNSDASIFSSMSESFMCTQAQN